VICESPDEADEQRFHALAPAQQEVVLQWRNGQKARRV
jgi:hypothetical protein